MVTNPFPPIVIVPRNLDSCFPNTVLDLWKLSIGLVLARSAYTKPLIRAGLGSEGNIASICQPLDIYATTGWESVYSRSLCGPLISAA